MNFDIAPDGTIYGIELLNANQKLAADNQGKVIVLVNESTKLEEAEAAESYDWHHLAVEQFFADYNEEDAFYDDV